MASGSSACASASRSSTASSISSRPGEGAVSRRGSPPSGGSGNVPAGRVAARGRAGGGEASRPRGPWGSRRARRRARRAPRTRDRRRLRRRPGGSLVRPRSAAAGREPIVDHHDVRACLVDRRRSRSRVPDVAGEGEARCPGDERRQRDVPSRPAGRPVARSSRSRRLHVHRIVTPWPASHRPNRGSRHGGLRNPSVRASTTRRRSRRRSRHRTVRPQGGVISSGDLVERLARRVAAGGRLEAGVGDPLRVAPRAPARAPRVRAAGAHAFDDEQSECRRRGARGTHRGRRGGGTSRRRLRRPRRARQPACRAPHRSRDSPRRRRARAAPGPRGAVPPRACAPRPS